MPPACGERHWVFSRNIYVQKRLDCQSTLRGVTHLLRPPFCSKHKPSLPESPFKLWYHHQKPSARVWQPLPVAVDAFNHARHHQPHLYVTVHMCIVNFTDGPSAGFTKKYWGKCKLRCSDASSCLLLQACCAIIVLGVAAALLAEHVIVEKQARLAAYENCVTRTVYTEWHLEDVDWANIDPVIHAWCTNVAAEAVSYPEWTPLKPIFSLVVLVALTGELNRLIPRGLKLTTLVIQIPQA